MNQILIRLNDKMVDLDKLLKVISIDGSILFESKVVRLQGTAKRTFDSRRDKFLTFFTEILVDLKTNKAIQITDKLDISDSNGNSIFPLIKKNISIINEDKEIQLLGGWRAAEVNQNVEEAVSFMLRQLNSSSNLKKILSSKKQVVKGMNYDLSTELENGEVWNSIVYRDLSGEFSFLKQPAKIEKL